ncbi:MAG: DUF2157 domain-containing protein [Actinobacteria bacterium]|nr:DUF2157 domain-containing protein [Actinomycetota bacterium]
MSTEIAPALQELIDAGTLTREQALAVHSAMSEKPEPVTAFGAVQFSNKRSFISEALTYVGFVFVIAAAALLTNQAWEGLGQWGRPSLLGAGAVVLFGAGSWMRIIRKDDSGRRLSSTLYVGSEALVAGTIGLILNEVWVPKNPSYLDPGSPLWQEPARWVNPAMAVSVGAGALIVGAVAYLLSGSALGQVAMAAPSAAMAIGSGQLIIALTNDTDQVGPARLGSAILFAGGLLWIALEHYDYLHEKVVGQVLGIVAMFSGLQGMGFDLKVWASSSVLVILGLGLLVFYLQGHAWPYLAGGIIGMFAGGVRMLVEYVHGTSGALASLALGILLVVFGVRIVNDRREPTMLVQAETRADGNSDDQNDQSVQDNVDYKNIEPF